MYPQIRFEALSRISFAIITSILVIAVAAAEASARPARPYGGFAADCGPSLTERPKMCVEFQNAANEPVRFLLEWTENGRPMSPNLHGRSECRSGSAQFYYCSALQSWFSGPPAPGTGRGYTYVTRRAYPEGFRVTNLAYSTEYCFHFRAVDQLGVQSDSWSGWTCGRTPPQLDGPKAPAPPRVTALAATSGKGEIGPGTPFRVLVEWDPAPDENGTVGWYSIETLMKQGWISNPLRYRPRSGNEGFVEFPNGSDQDESHAFRVCAENIVGRACSTGARTPGRWWDNVRVKNPGKVFDNTGGVLVQGQAKDNPGGEAAGSFGNPKSPLLLPPLSNVSYIYSVTSDGTLQWRRYDGNAAGSGALSDPVEVATGWDEYKDVFPGGSNIIYAVTQDGTLRWFKHTGFSAGLGAESEGAWETKDLGDGWADYEWVFSGGGGLIYAMRPGGKLYWFKHTGYLDGRATMEGPKEIGSHWDQFKRVFPGGEGIIYVVAADNRLKWLRHIDYLNGAKAWEEPPKDVGGPGWGTYQNVFTSGAGVIYAVTEGKLVWQREIDYAKGVKNWEGPKDVGGEGWADALHVFALLPAASEVRAFASSQDAIPVKRSDGGIVIAGGRADWEKVAADQEKLSSFPLQQVLHDLQEAEARRARDAKTEGSPSHGSTNLIVLGPMIGTLIGKENQTGNDGTGAEVVAQGNHTGTGNPDRAAGATFLPENIIRVLVAYKKELGYKGDSIAFGHVGPTSCDAFSVSVAVGDEAARPKDPISIKSESKMESAGGYYVCSYLVSGLPFNQIIRVSVGVSGSDLSVAWKGGSNSQPSPGQERVIFAATKTETLTATKPRASISFEMAYAPAAPR